MKHRNLLSLICAVFAGAAFLASAQGDRAVNVETPCVYDPATQRMRECFHVKADGSCAHFGGDCSTPAKKTPCIFDKSSNAYRECFHVTADGSCAHFGGPCTP